MERRENRSNYLVKKQLRYVQYDNYFTNNKRIASCKPTNYILAKISEKKKTIKIRLIK